MIKLTRQVTAGLAGMALAICGSVALPTAAQAQELSPPQFFDTCDNTDVYLPGWGGQRWLVEVDGSHYWPGEDDQQPDKWGIHLFIPADAGEITLHRLNEEAPLEVSHTWQEPVFCALIPNPESTEPTCDTSGQLTIQDFPPDDHPDFPPEPPTDDERDEEDEPRGPRWMLDGEEVAKGSAYEVEPGSHAVEFRHDARTLKTWYFEIGEPSCGDESEGKKPSTDELAQTGVPAGLIAGGAVLLLATGAALLLISRRRGITA